MINNQNKELIENNPVAFATVSFNGTPNVICVMNVKVIDNNKILITDNYMKQTKDNLQNNDNVCLAVWDNEYNGIKIIGKAEYYSEGKWKKYVEKMPENEGFSAKGAILVNVEKIISLS